MIHIAPLALAKLLAKLLLRALGKRSLAYARHLHASHRAYKHAERHEQNRLRDEEVIHSLAKQQRPARLHIGAGFNQLEGWINTDLEPEHAGCLTMDAGRPLPIESETLGHIFCEHLIEHLPRAQGVQLIAESFRCLVPGGRLRIATPDLSVYLSLFDRAASSKTGIDATDQPSEQFLKLYGRLLEDEPMTANKAINHVVRNWGHQFIWTKDELTGVLRSAGFVDISEHDIGQSEDSALRDVERHQLTVDGQVNQLETMVLEACKPKSLGER